MGFFDSISSSSTVNNTQNIKQDTIVGNGSTVVQGTGNTYNQLDGGAISGAFDFAKSSAFNSIEFANSNNKQSFEFANSNNKQSFDFAKAQGAISGANYEKLLNTTSSALSSLLGGVASTQNFIASTQAQASGQMDNRTKMIIGVAGLAVIGLLIWSRK